MKQSETRKPRKARKRHPTRPNKAQKGQTEPGKAHYDPMAGIRTIVAEMLDRRSILIFGKPFKDCNRTQKGLAVVFYNLSAPADCQLEFSPADDKEEL